MRLPDVRRSARRGALLAFPHLPRALRRGAVRVATPSFTVGCVLVATDDRDRVLLLRQRHYGTELTLPGGLLQRGERPHEGLQRELREEVGLTTEVTLPTTVVVEPTARRVDLVFSARFVGEPAQVRPRADEAMEVFWCGPTELLAASETTLVVLSELARARQRADGTVRIVPGAV